MEFLGVFQVEVDEGAVQQAVSDVECEVVEDVRFTNQLTPNRQVADVSAQPLSEHIDSTGVLYHLSAHSQEQCSLLESVITQFIP